MLSVGLRMNIKKRDLATVDEVYALIGITRKGVSKWHCSPVGTQTKNRCKYNVIIRTGELFGLDRSETEQLANKAGLSLDADDSFPEHFNCAICAYPGKKRELCERAGVSDRMFFHIKSGRHLRKESLTALLIEAGTSLGETQRLLRKAGYVLSHSVPGDVIVMWMLENDLREQSHKHINPVSYINEVLHTLGLPLLMTREKSQKT